MISASAVMIALIVAFIGGFYLGLSLIIAGTIVIRRSQRRKLGVGLRIWGYIVAIPCFCIGVIIGTIVVLIPCLVGIVLALIICSFVKQKNTSGTD